MGWAPGVFASIARARLTNNRSGLALERSGRPLRKVAVSDREPMFGVSALVEGRARACDQSRNAVMSDTSPRSPTVSAPEQSSQMRSPCAVADMKARQSAKIRELREALVTTGFLTLDAQARALGLSRSTTWSILKGNHKSSGLSATIIERMLVAPRLPPLVRAKIHEYIEDKMTGLYGGNKMRLRKFTARLTVTSAARDGTAAVDQQPGGRRARSAWPM
jgi:hypothetical protein